MRARPFRRHAVWTAVAALGLLLTAALMPGRVGTAPALGDTELVVLVHPALAVSKLDRNELQAVFLRRRLTWDDGTRIVPFNYTAGDPMRSMFDQVVLGLTPEQVARYWIDARIRSGTEAPRSLPSPAVLARVITQLPGSIGYVPAAYAPAGAKIVARIAQGRLAQ